MIRTLLLLLLALVATPAAAQSLSQQPHTRLELITESRTPKPGEPLGIGLRLTPNPGWHTYWRNPGDAGAPTRVAWTLPAGTPEPPPLAYPIPETLVVSGLMNYVYPHSSVLLTTITPPAGLKKKTPLPISVKVDWLVCSLDQCVPESATVSLALAIGDGTTDPDNGYVIAMARAALPKPVTWAATWRAEKGRFVLAVPFGNPEKVSAAYFYPAEDGAIDYAAPQTVTVAGDRLRIETEASPTQKARSAACCASNAWATTSRWASTSPPSPAKSPPPGWPSAATARRPAPPASASSSPAPSSAASSSTSCRACSRSSA